MHRTVKRNVLLDPDELKIEGTKLSQDNIAAVLYDQSKLLYNRYQGDTLLQGHAAVHKTEFTSTNYHG